MRVNAKTETFERVTVFGHPMLFTCLRIDPKTVPEDLYLYSVRHDDDCLGIPVEICKWVMVNHWGDLISSTPISLKMYGSVSGNGYRDVGEDDFIYEGCTATLEEYIRENQPAEHAEV